MNLVFPRGRSWLRIDLLSPANFGSSGGRATLDRPVALNAETRLPLIPFSALSGVLAGRLGNVYEDQERQTLNARRTRIFGAPDHQESTGTPGELVLGDGEILSFPAPLADGRVACVVPLSTVARLVHTGLLSYRIPRLNSEYLALTFVQRLPPEVVVDSNPDVLPPLLAAVAPLAGEPRDRIVLAAPGSARVLWRRAAEERSLTALNGSTRRARSGSLRRIELVPRGTRFIVLVTNHSSRPLDLGADRFQLGGWESWGCGQVRGTLVSSVSIDDAPNEPAITAPSERVREESDLMVDAFRALRELSVDLRPKLRALLRETASRMSSFGIGPALAFSLAKARFQSQDPSLERRSHRWLLGALFNDTDPYRATIDAITGISVPADLERYCRWLSRYAELLDVSTDGADE